MAEVDEILRLANNEVGYLEKASNSQLDDKTANAGSNNYTKYARDMDNLGVYNGPKQGYPWCKVFIDWLFVQALGLDRAGNLLIGWTAGVTQFFNWFNNAGQIYNDPKIGDLVIFGDCDHIGIVSGVDGSRIYTIEGNTSGSTGLVANGGCVANKMYYKTSSYIKCYARPKYDGEPGPEPQPTPGPRLLYNGCSGDDVRYLQSKLIEKGYSLPRYGADSFFGNETEYAVRQLQSDAGIDVDGIVGNDTWNIIESSFVRPDRPEYPGYLIGYGDAGEDVRMIQQRLIELGYSCGYYGADGIFGNATRQAVISFQRDNGLSRDGIVGPETWNALF